MINKETVEAIGNNINALIEFVNVDPRVVPDFQSYLHMIGFKGTAGVAMQKVLVPYIFERRIGESRSSVIDLYMEAKKVSDEDKKILEALKNSLSSVFRVNNLFKTGFDLFNIVNEKDYAIYSMVKMTNLRGVGPGQFLVARIVKVDGDYYMLELNEIITASQEEKAYRLAVAKQIQDPSMLYRDNEKKTEELRAQIQEVGEKFVEFFGKKQVITVNHKADDLLGAFNEFVEDGQKLTKKTLGDLILEPKEQAFFEVSSQNADFMQAAAQGFSAEKRPYDIGIAYDDDLGLFVVPFLNTFNAIFEAENPADIEGYKECVKHFLESDKIPPFVLKKAYTGRSKQFLKIVEEATDEKFKSLKAINEKYKADYLESDKFSSATVLYLSGAFNDLMGFAEKEQERAKVPAMTVKVGRNEPCPCGSGKKYKKCCGGV